MSLKDLADHHEIFKNAVKYCNKCKHRFLDPGDTCTAFPDGIPDEVLFGDKDHRFPVEGDHGIQFEPKE
jgi:hypothetical protein